MSTKPRKTHRKTPVPSVEARLTSASPGEETKILKRTRLRYRNVDDLVEQGLRFAGVPIQKLQMSFASSAPDATLTSIVGFSLSLRIGGGYAVDLDDLPMELLPDVLAWLAREALLPRGDLFLVAFLRSQTFEQHEAAWRATQRRHSPSRNVKKRGTFGRRNSTSREQDVTCSHDRSGRTDLRVQSHAS